MAVALNPADYRLPEYVRPSHYKLELTPCLHGCVFAGEVWIKVEVTADAPEQVDRFWLNAHPELTIKRVTLAPSAVAGAEDLGVVPAEDQPETPFSWQKELERVELQPASPLKPGDSLVLYMAFDGVLNDDMAGFYRTKYTSAKDGKQRWAACTQFESVDARRCFPCFDEPAFKAIFELVVSAPADLVCVSNMPVAKSEEEEAFAGHKIVTYHFEPSPIMSTYLVTVVIGEFEHIETTTESGVLVRVFTPIGKAEQGRFSLDVAAKSLEIYTKYFEVPYPLPKLDLLAIPDFAAGAMEGWGCTTYREIVLLVDPKQTSSAVMQRSCLTVSHEVAHQWFGNLSTMTWWNDLWLNESFATYLEYSITDQLYPDWKVWDQFVCSDFAQTLALDCLMSSHSIQQNDTFTRDQIDEIFDVITYCKGASVLRMLITACSEPVFQRGMAQYMRNFAYKNTLTADLWQALEAASGRQIGSLMEGWITQTGYPLLTVEGEPELDAASGELVIKLSQTRFLLDAATEDPENPLWKIPIHVQLPESHQPEAHDGADFLVFGDRQGEIRVPLKQASVPAWFKLNAGQEGLYRVRYTAPQQAALAQGIRAGELVTSTDLIGLLSDTLALCRTGAFSTPENLLPLLAVLGDCLRTQAAPKPDPNVWSEIEATLATLHAVLSHSDIQDQEFGWFGQWAGQQVLAPAAKAIGGWNAGAEDPHALKLLRRDLIGALVRYQDSETVTEAVRRVRLFLEDPTKGGLDGDLRGPALAAYVAQGGEAEFETILARISGKKADAEDQKEPEEDMMVEHKLQYLFALASTQNEKLVDRALELARTEVVRGQDLPSYLTVLMRNRAASKRTWSWIKENWESVVTQRCASANGPTRVIQSLGAQSSDEMLVDIEKFFGAREVKGSERTIRQILEKVRLNNAWMKRELPTLLAQFKSFHEQQQQQQ